MPADYYHKLVDAIASTGDKGIPVREAFQDADVPKPLYDVVWKRLKATGDFLTFVCGEDTVDGPVRTVLPLSSIQEGHVESLSAEQRVMASQETQEAYVGVYANRVQRNAYSEMQIQSLAKLTKWGTEGLPQSELTKQMDSKGNNFGYVVKVLMERGQIFNKKVTLKAQQGGAATQTSMLYLTKHQPAVEAALKTEGGKVKSIDVDGKRCEIQFEDDEELMRKVLRYLNNPDGSLEPLLKKSCSFTGSAGHKLWRRIKQKMIDEGLVEEQRVRVKTDKEGKDPTVKIVIKKIKELEEETHVPAVPSLVTKPPRLPAKQFVELSLDKQVLHQLVISGTYGATSADMSSQLGLNLKKHTLRFTDMSDRFKDGSEGIEKKKVTVGKSSQMSFIPSQAVRDAFKRTHRTFFGVEVAEEEELDNTVVVEEHEPKPDFALPEGELARNEVFMKRYVWLCTKILKQGFFLGQQAGSFLLKEETKWAQTRGRPVPKEIDHKTVSRLTDAAVQLKVIEKKLGTVMSKDGKAAQVWIYLPFGKVLDDALMSQVTAAHTASFKNRAKKKDENENTQNLPIVNESDVALAGEEDASKSKSFIKFNLQTGNGYHASKLLRCRDIAELICGIIDGRSDDYCSESFGRLVKAAESDNYELKQCLYAPSRRGAEGKLPLDADLPHQDYSTYEPTPENNRRVFAFDEVWNAMTVPVFLTALGSACEMAKHPGFIERIRSKCLADLSLEELEMLAGPDKGDLEAARGHLQEVLNKLLNLGVLKMISPAGSFDDGQPTNKSVTHYLMNSVVVHQVLWYHREPEGEDLVKFDFSNIRQREGYWNSLQYLFAMKKVQLHRYQKEGGKDEQPPGTQICWPVSKVKVDKNLGRRNLSSHPRYESLKSKILSPGFDLDRFRWKWEDFARLAEEYQMDIETCVRTLADAQRPKSQGSVRTGGSGRRNKGRSRSRHRARVHGRGSEIELPEEEEQFILLQPETQPPPIRKRKWYDYEDRELLRAWAGWVAEQGSAAKVKLALMKLPQGIRVPSCNNRLQKLMSDDAVKKCMENIKREADIVYNRHKQTDEAEKAAAGAVAAPSAGRAKTEAQAKRKVVTPGLGSDIFDIRDNDDMVSMSVITGLIERVVQAAPERPVEGGELSSSRFERLSKATPDGSNPLEYFRWLCNYAEKARAKSEKARGQAAEPSVEVTAALSVILSCLYEVEFIGKSSDSIRALFDQKRFSTETMKGAIKHLCQNNLVEIGEGQDGQPVMCLSELYKEGTKPPFAPMMLNEDNASILKSKDRSLWPLPAQRNPLALSPLLSLGVMGLASFALEVPADIQGPQPHQKEDDMDQFGDQCLRRNMASISVSATDGAGEGIVASNTSVHRCAGFVTSAVAMTKLGPGRSIKFPPSEVLKSSKKHKEAKDAFFQQVKSILGVDAGNSILKAVVDGGANGITASSLQSLLEHNNLNADLQSVEKIKGLLLEHGLARLLGGYNELRVVNAMTSEHLVANEVPLRPWIDSDGRVIRPLWQSLVLKLIDLASRIPGIRGDHLVASLRIFPPHFAREIISSLCNSGVLHCCASHKGTNETKKMKRGIWDVNGDELELDTELFAVTEPFVDTRRADADYCFFVNPEKALWAVR